MCTLNDGEFTLSYYYLLLDTCPRSLQQFLIQFFHVRHSKIEDVVLLAVYWQTIIFIEFASEIYN